MTADRKPVVLVTGGAGFVGSHIANSLAGGWQVRVFDNLSCGSLANVADDPDISVQIGDIRSEQDVAAAFAAGPVDAVVHCAAQTSVPLSMVDPGLDREVNVAGTRRLLRAASAAGARRFVFMSSGGALYGETTQPATEDVFPSPRSYYGLHKFAAEQMVRAEGIPYAILRPSNIYGPRQRSDIDGGVVAIFLERLAAGDPVDLYGDGDQFRDFVFVDDVVRAVAAALAVRENVVWNVSSAVATSINQLLERLVELSGAKAEVRRLPARPGDVRASVLARDLLAAYLPRPTPLNEGLRRTIDSLSAPRASVAAAAVLS
jgi:UDP-glucose 4-epimerase